MAQFPGLRQLVPGKISIWGEEVRYPWSGLTPAQFRTLKSPFPDPVDMEIIRLYYSGFPVSAEQLERKFGGIKLPSDIYNRYQAIYGKALYQAYLKAITHPDYANLSDLEKQKLLNKAREEVRRKIKILMSLELPQFREKLDVEPYQIPIEIQYLINLLEIAEPDFPKKDVETLIKSWMYQQ